MYLFGQHDVINEVGGFSLCGFEPYLLGQWVLERECSCNTMVRPLHEVCAQALLVSSYHLLKIRRIFKEGPQVN